MKPVFKMPVQEGASRRSVRKPAKRESFFQYDRPHNQQEEGMIETMIVIAVGAIDLLLIVLWVRLGRKWGIIP